MLVLSSLLFKLVRFHLAFCHCGQYFGKLFLNGRSNFVSQFILLFNVKGCVVTVWFSVILGGNGPSGLFPAIISSTCRSGSLSSDSCCASPCTMIVFVFVFGGSFIVSESVTDLFSAVTLPVVCSPDVGFWGRGALVSVWRQLFERNDFPLFVDSFRIRRFCSFILSQSSTGKEISSTAVSPKRALSSISSSWWPGSFRPESTLFWTLCHLLTYQWITTSVLLCH